MKCKFCNKKFHDDGVRTAADHLYFHVRKKHLREYRKIVNAAAAGEKRSLPRATEPQNRQSHQEELLEAYGSMVPEDYAD